MTFSGAGAVTGALVVAWLGKKQVHGTTSGDLAYAAGTIIVGFGRSRRTYLSVLLLFTAGALFVMCSSLTTSLAQLLAPPEFRGRVISIYFVALLGGSPLGNLASGWLVTRFGSAQVMLVLNGTALTLVALYFLTPGRGVTDI
jgi:hypothetical protein